MHPIERAPYSYKDDPKVPAFDDTGPRTVMDANCGICARGARWIARADKGAAFKIIPMQDPLGIALFHHYGMDPADPVSWLLIEDGRAYASLDAIIRVGRRLGGVSSALRIFGVFPRALQDWGYGLLARNRYRLSRPADMCAMPDPDVQTRLIRT